MSRNNNIIMSRSDRILDLVNCKRKLDFDLPLPQSPDYNNHSDDDIANESKENTASNNVLIVQAEINECSTKKDLSIYQKINDQTKEQKKIVILEDVIIKNASPPRHDIDSVKTPVGQRESQSEHGYEMDLITVQREYNIEKSLQIQDITLEGENFTMPIADITFEGEELNDCKNFQNDDIFLNIVDAIITDMMMESHDIEKNKKVEPQDPIELQDIGGTTEESKAAAEVVSDVTRLERNVKAKKNIKRKTQKKKSITKSDIDCLDFLSDGEIQNFGWDSSSREGTDSDETDIEEPKAKRKKNKNRKNKKVSDAIESEVVGERGYKKKRTNEKKERSKKRNAGESYITASGRVIKEKELKRNPCVTAIKCPHNCSEIDENKRENVFKYFNSLDNQRKKDWIVAMTTVKKLENSGKETTRRENTFNYYINEGEGRRQVCLRFLLKTLDVSQKFLYYTISNSNMGLAKEDCRGKTEPANKTKEELREDVRTFIKELPAVPSHYCRKDSKRLYLPEDMKSVRNLYSKYVSENKTNNRKSVSENVFRHIFKSEFNLSFHVPNKDKCRQCVAFKNNAENLSEKDKEAKEEHEREVTLANKRFKIHKEIRAKDESILCASFDMQKVLNTPKGTSMLLFYSRKYGVLNETIYESGTQNGYCYVWGESEGKRGANEIGTILAKYIKDVDQRKAARKLLLYSDSCSGQNKNKVVLAIVHATLLTCTHIDTIQINYLIPGHTKMPVDSMHAVIENSVDNATIWAPSQWLTVIQIARKNPKPYVVNPLTHEDFLNCESFAEKYFKGNLAGKTRKLKVVTMKKEKPTAIFTKMSFEENSPVEEIKVIGSQKQLEQIYKKPLPLSNPKYTDLTKLCKTMAIPKLWHSEFTQLPHSSKQQDCLIETDEEDVDNNEVP